MFFHKRLYFLLSKLELHENLKEVVYLCEVNLFSHTEQACTFLFALNVIVVLFSLFVCQIPFQLLAFIIFSIRNGFIWEFKIYMHIYLYAFNRVIIISTVSSRLVYFTSPKWALSSKIHFQVGFKKSLSVSRSLTWC